MIQRNTAQSADFHRIRHEAALKSWETRKRADKEATKTRPSRGDWANKNAETERALAETPVTGAKPLGGGISETYKIVLANGMVANFKVSASPESEVGAWEVAKLVGMDDLVPPAVIREVDVPGGGGLAPVAGGIRGGGRRYPPGVKRGSAALWKEGQVAGDIDEHKAFDGIEDSRRAAIFDFVIGNSDRHNGNWVLNADGKIGLIDHNLAFSGFPQSEFIDRAQRPPNGILSPAKYIAPYLAKKSQIADRLRKSGLAEEQIGDVLRRIDRAASAKSWRDVYDDPGRYDPRR